MPIRCIVWNISARLCFFNRNFLTQCKLSWQFLRFVSVSVILGVTSMRSLPRPGASNFSVFFWESYTFKSGFSVLCKEKKAQLHSELSLPPLCVPGQRSVDCIHVGSFLCSPMCCTVRLFPDQHHTVLITVALCVISFKSRNIRSPVCFSLSG